METVRMHKDGSYIEVALTISPVSDITGKIIGISTIIHDMSAHKTAERERESLIAKLAESNTELERFAYIASHDMQEPIRMVNNFSRLIAEEYTDKLNDEGKEYIGIITTSAERMQAMIDDLLEYARIGNSNINPVWVNASEEVKHVIENLSSLIKECNATVTYDDLPKFKGNPVQFMRLLQNLISNGLKYQAQGNTPKIHIAAQSKRDHWCFSVQDNGIGIDKEFVNEVFEPFKRLHSSDLASALKTLAENEFDVVLLDRSLPDTTGFNGLISIQNIAPKLPIIFLTGLKDEAIALSAVEKGAQDYLFKDNTDNRSIERAIHYAIRRKQFEEVLILQANFDNLTGLVNRILFENRLDIALTKMKRQDEGIAVFFLDIDRFKQVNDTLGHATGDHLLQQVGERLRHVLRPYDTVARFGGDEFALLIDGIKTSHECASIAQKILKIFDIPFNISGTQIDISVSIGIATCMNNESASREKLMKQADEAMYDAKTISHSEYRFYT